MREKSEYQRGTCAYFLLRYLTHSYISMHKVRDTSGHGSEFQCIRSEGLLGVFWESEKETIGFTRSTWNAFVFAFVFVFAFEKTTIAVTCSTCNALAHLLVKTTRLNMRKSIKCKTSPFIKQNIVLQYSNRIYTKWHFDKKSEGVLD